MSEPQQNGQIWQYSQALPGIATLPAAAPVQPYAFEPHRNPGPRQICMELAAEFARQNSMYNLQDIALKCTSLWKTCLYTSRPIAQQRFIHSTIYALNSLDWPWIPPADPNAHSTRPLRRYMKDFIAITAFCAYIMSLVPRAWVPHSAEMRIPFLKASKAMLECYGALNQAYPDCTELASSIWGSTVAANLSGDPEEWPRLDAEAKMIRFRDQIDQEDVVHTYIPLESAQLTSVFWIMYHDTLISRAFPTPSPDLKTFHDLCKDPPFTDREWNGSKGDSRRDRIRANPIMEGLLHKLFHKSRRMWEKFMELIDEVRTHPVVPFKPARRSKKKGKSPDMPRRVVDEAVEAKLRIKHALVGDFAEEGPMWSEFYAKLKEAGEIPTHWPVSRSRTRRLVHTMRADFYYLSLVLVHECCIRDLHYVVGINDTPQSMASTKIYLANKFLEQLFAVTGPWYMMQGEAAVERVRVVCAFLHQVQQYKLPIEMEHTALKTMECGMLHLHSMDVEIAKEFLAFVSEHGYGMCFARMDKNGKIIFEEEEGGGGGGKDANNAKRQRCS